MEEQKTIEAGMVRVAIRLRIHPPKRQNPSQRLKRKLYYRRNRTKIVMQRRRYLRSHRSQLKIHRKLFHRFKPAWARSPKPIIHKPHKPKKFKLFVPHIIRPRKPHFFMHKAPKFFGIKIRH